MLHDGPQGPKILRNNANCAPTNAVVCMAFMVLARMSVGLVVLREGPHVAREAGPPSRLGFSSIRRHFEFPPDSGLSKGVVLRLHVLLGFIVDLVVYLCLGVRLKIRFDEECALGCGDAGRKSNLRPSSARN
jgi:hypothetical protein